MGKDSKHITKNKDKNEKKCEIKHEIKNNSDKNIQHYKNMNVICNAECLVTTAELVRPKMQVKTEELSTISLGYMMNKHPNKLGENQRLRVLVDSGCGQATLINKKCVKKWKNPETRVLNGQ